MTSHDATAPDARVRSAHPAPATPHGPTAAVSAESGALHARRATSAPIATPPASPAAVAATTAHPTSTTLAAGCLDGGAMETQRAIRRAQLSQRAKNLLLWLHEQTYGPDAQMRYASGDPDWCWVEVDLKQLAAEEDDYPSNLSVRFQQLIEAHILRVRRGRNKALILAFWPAALWPAVIFDRERAKELHRRAGAGAPPDVRPPAPEIPFAERSSDRRGRAWLTRDALKTDDEWTFVQHFQTSADEAFQPMWLPALRRLIDAYGADVLVMSLTNVLQYYTAHDRRKELRYPWGAFLTDVQEKAPRGYVHAGQPASRGGGVSSHGIYRRTTASDRAPAGDTDSGGATPDAADGEPTGYLARAAARSKARLLAIADELDELDAAEQPGTAAASAASVTSVTSVTPVTPERAASAGRSTPRRE